MVSEEMSFENADGRTTTTDACVYYKLTYETSAQVNYKHNKKQVIFKDPWASCFVINSD